MHFAIPSKREIVGMHIIELNRERIPRNVLRGALMSTGSERYIPALNW